MGMIENRDKVVVITGGARGIGYDMAIALSEEGLHTVICDVSDEVYETFNRIKEVSPDNEGFAMQTDVSKEEEVKTLFDKTINQFGKIDIVINNAGINGGEVYIDEVEESLVDKVFNVNFKGMLFGCKYAAILMKKQKFGSIVNTGSFYGKVGHPGSGLYGASKAAGHTLTQAVAMELAPYGVNVNAVCPALADSEMHWAYIRKEAEEKNISFESLKENELKGIPLNRLGTGRDSAGAVLWLASEGGAYVTGQLINVNGGVYFD